MENKLTLWGGGRGCGMEKTWFLFLFVCLIVLIVTSGIILKEGLIVTNMNQRIPWGIWEAAYIFCTGLSAGSFVISTLGLFGFKEFKAISRIAVVQALILLMIAPVFLFLAMGHPWRFYLIYLSPNPTSVITWGAFLVLIYPVICAIYGFYQMRRNFTKLTEIQIAKDEKRARFFGFLGIPAAIFVHGYTGVLLGFIKARALWYTSLMPVLFLTSAIVSGIALLIVILSILNVYTNIKSDKVLITHMSKLLLVFIVVDLFFLVAEVLTGLYGGGEHARAWMVLITGSYAWLFLGVEIFLGVFIPIYLLVFIKRTSAVVVASVLVVIGVFAMRCNIVMGGQVIQAYGGPLGEYIPSAIEWLVMLGVFGLGALFYTLAIKFLPLQVKIEKSEMF